MLMDGRAGDDAAVTALTRNRRESLQGVSHTPTIGMRGDLSGLSPQPLMPTSHVVIIEAVGNDEDHAKVCIPYYHSNMHDQTH